MNNVIPSICEKRSQYICRDTGEEMILIRLENNVADFNQYLTLNEVGVFIWEHLEPSDDEKTIATKICAEFEAHESEVLEDVKAFLKKLIAYLDNQ